MKQKLFTFFLALVASVSATLATTTEITVPKALEIGAALAELATTDETYDIVGYVTQIAEENIEKLKTLKSLSYDISNDIIKSKHSVILNKSLIEEAEKRLEKYINHVNNF